MFELTNIETVGIIAIIAIVITVIGKNFHSKIIKLKDLNNSIRRENNIKLDDEDKYHLKLWETEWHNRFYVLLGIMIICLSFFAFDIIINITLNIIFMASIWWVGDIILNLLMGWKWNYRGNEFWDKFSMWIRIVLLTVVTIVLIILNS